MWFASVRDLQWRRRRFLIGAVGAALIFSVTLLMAGLSQSLRVEINRTLAATGADTWVASAGAAGPLTGSKLLPDDEAGKVAEAPGVKQADPILVLHEAIQRPNGVIDVIAFGHRPGGLGSPPLKSGRAIAGPGEAVVNDSLHLPVGAHFQLGVSDFRVAGVTKKMTMEGGIPALYLDIGQLQQLDFYGQKAAVAVLTKGVPNPPPDGLRVWTPDQVTGDVLRQLHGLVDAISLVKILLWGVAAALIGSLVYLTALERTVDFAVFKATGSPTYKLMIGLAIQAILIATVAVVGAIGLAYLLVPFFPVPLVVPGSAVATLPFVALAVALLSSAASLRRAVAVDPVLAFSS
jgi:putative ABC transport system permease protein